jgi:hypothetical protein
MPLIRRHVITFNSPTTETHQPASALRLAGLNRLRLTNL